jgi:hypothetical protein
MPAHIRRVLSIVGLVQTTHTLCLLLRASVLVVANQIFIKCPRWIWLWCNEHISVSVISKTLSLRIVCGNPLVALYEVRLQTCPRKFPYQVSVSRPSMSSVSSMPVMTSVTTLFVSKKCVVCHYAQLTFPVPAVIVETL